MAERGSDPQCARRDKRADKKTPNNLLLTLFFHLERKTLFPLTKKNTQARNPTHTFVFNWTEKQHKDLLYFYFVCNQANHDEGGRIFRAHLSGQHSSSECLSILFKSPPLESKTTGFSLVVFQIAVLLFAHLHCLSCGARTWTGSSCPAAASGSPEVMTANASSRFL